ncbi:unnamed protein product [Dovyalis caffra]|uniref:Uncharacterized protein n=1 Tax=Dovyalis caffra TaxID=77055 RepID=A0AAV1R8G0_9ROSI|nr:unnamed protein product [Dovyalis caffra]
MATKARMNRSEHQTQEPKPPIASEFLTARPTARGRLLWLSNNGPGTSAMLPSSRIVWYSSHLAFDSKQTTKGKLGEEACKAFTDLKKGLALSRKSDYGNKYSKFIVARFSRVIAGLQN